MRTHQELIRELRSLSEIMNGLSAMIPECRNTKNLLEEAADVIEEYCLKEPE